MKYHNNENKDYNLSSAFDPARYIWKLCQDSVQGRIPGLRWDAGAIGVRSLPAGAGRTRQDGNFRAAWNMKVNTTMLTNAFGDIS